MPTWGELMSELSGNPRDFDNLRRKYLVNAHNLTGRNVILYATQFTSGNPGIPPQLLSINDEDIQGLMEVCHGLTQTKLDLVIHSPGGSLSAAEGIVTYLRSKFDDIRVIVPNLAKSAATMIACAADVIVMGKHSFLGPIDPQFSTTTPLGPRMLPVEAVLEQFELAKRECSDPKKLAAWLPMLSQYGPDFVVQCQHASALSQQLVASWLTQYMFKDDKNATKKGEDIAKWLGDHTQHRLHSRHIPRTELEKRGLKIQCLEEDQDEQDAFLSIFHAATHTFNGTGCVKIIENQKGKSFIKQISNGSPPPSEPSDKNKAAKTAKKKATKKTKKKAKKKS